MNKLYLWFKYGELGDERTFWFDIRKADSFYKFLRLGGAQLFE